MEAHAGNEVDTDQMPPGTISIQDLSVAQRVDDAIILSPQPSQDPNDPLNWKKWEKYINIALVLLYSLIVYGLMSAYTPTWSSMNIELGFSYELLNDSYASGTAALCVGSIFFIPLALKFGRRPIYVFSLATQIGIAAWAARIQTGADLILINVFDNLLGALAESIVQMTIADVFFVHERGSMNGIYVWTMMFGTAMAPVAAGYITDSQGWRWLWWWVAIILAVTFLLFFFLYEETMFRREEIEGISPPEAELGAADDINKEDIEALKVKEGIAPGTLKTTDNPSTTLADRPRKTYWQKLALWSDSGMSAKQMLHHGLQPLIILFTFPAVTYAAVLYGVCTAGLQMSATAISSYMALPPYNFDASQIGLMSIPPFIGTTLAALVTAPLNDRLAVWLAHRNGGVYEPEMRLWLLLAMSPFVPAGFLLFGYALGGGKSWVLVAVGNGLFSFGLTPVCGAVLTFVTDAYTDVIGDAVVGITFLRNAFATIFIFVLTPWATAVGLGNVFLVVSIILILIFLFSLFFIWHGKKLRVRTAARYRAYAAMHMNGDLAQGPFLSWQ